MPIEVAFYRRGAPARSGMQEEPGGTKSHGAILNPLQNEACLRLKLRR